MYDNDHLDEQWLRQTPPPRRRGAGCGLTLLLVLLLVLAGAVFYPRIRARLTPVPAVQIRVESSVLPDTAPNCTANPRTAAVLRSAMRDQTDAAVYDCDAATLEACMAELLDDPELWVRSYQYTVHGGLNAHITVTFDWVYPDDGPARRAQLRAGKGSDVLPGEHDLPGGGALQQRQTAQQRGFSRARHADDAVDVSFADLQVHILQRRHARALPLKDLRQMRYRDQNRFSFSFPLCTALRRSKQKARPRNLRSKDGQKCSRYHLVSLFPHGKSLSRCARG